MRLIYCLFIGLLINACSSEQKSDQTEALAPKTELKASIAELEKEVFDATGQLKPSKATELLSLYYGFANNNQLNDTSAEYLYLAAEMEMGLKRYDEAINTFERVVQNYPEFDKAPQSAYLMAFINDEYLDKKGKAKELYEKMINRFPRHPLANDARASIQLLGISDEDILKMLEEKNKENSPS